MYAVEFETDITSPFIKLDNYEQFLNQHVKVIVLSNQAVTSAEKLTGIGQLASFNKGRKRQDFNRLDAYNDDI